MNAVHFRRKLTPEHRVMLAGRIFDQGLIALAFLLASCGQPQGSVASIENATWTTAQGTQVALSSILGKRATVFLTLDPECPFCQLYAHDIQSMAARQAPGEVNFVGVYAGPFMERGKAAVFAADAGFNFPQLMDPACVLSLALKARVTPESFITDAAGTVVYRGAFDDRAVRQGRKKIEAGKHYLEDALAGFLREGKPQPEVTAVGCIVECGD